MKKVSIHQPNYLPWIGFFHKVSKSDCFVILDIAEYSNSGITNRNKIRTKDGWIYLTIPIGKKYHNARIVDVQLQDDYSWQRSHFKTLEANYKKSDYFYCHEDFFKKLYAVKYQHLWEINEKIIFYLLECFDINVEIIKSSDLSFDLNSKKTDLNINVLKEVGADIYLSGPSGRNYLETDLFKENNIKLEYTNFEHPIYKQRFEGFVPNLSAVDLLFNLGDKSKDLIS
jgi:WbqC-like protein family